MAHFGNMAGFIEKAVFYQRCSQYVNVASTAYLVLDYFQTFHAEIQLIWPRRWTLVKILFLLSRYLPFVYAPTTLWVGLQAVGAALEDCAVAFGASSVLILVSMMLAEAIMCVRLYALGKNSKRLLAWLLLQFIATQGTTFTVFALFVKSVKYLPSPIRSVPGCIPYRFDSQKLLIAFGMIVASQLVIMFLSSWVVLTKYQESTSPLLTVMYRDGFFYFVSLTLVTIANIVFHQLGPGELKFMLTLPQGVLHSTLACRLILHTHAFARRSIPGTRGTGEHTGTTLEFATAPPSTQGNIDSETSGSQDIKDSPSNSSWIHPSSEPFSIQMENAQWRNRPYNGAEYYSNSEELSPMSDSDKTAVASDAFTVHSRNSTRGKESESDSAFV